jgi:Protein of unknown function (DUF1645)
VVPTVTSQSLHYLSAPSSPKIFGHPSPKSDFYYYTSAPASPTRAEFSFDQAFGFSGQLQYDESQSALAAADELFEGGMIRPLIPNSSQFQPSLSSALLDSGNERTTEERGRSTSSLSINHRIGARSLSPVRSGNTEFHESQAPSSQNGSLTRDSGGSKKWRLKDFFLFRSASEGRATGRGSKDLLRKYTLLSATPSADIKYNDTNNGSMRKGRGAHERHYVMNRAATEEMKKKTPLPFHRNTLFGYLRSNPAIHSISRRWNGSHSNQNRP